MATEKSDKAEILVSHDAADVQQSVQAVEPHAWYQHLSEDWLATFFGLLLVILIVVGLLHSIP